MFKYFDLFDFEKPKNSLKTLIMTKKIDNLPNMIIIGRREYNNDEGNLVMFMFQTPSSFIIIVIVKILITSFIEVSRRLIIINVLKTFFLKKIWLGYFLWT